MIKWPQNLIQTNRSDIAGIHETFNIDLAANLGRIRTTRTKLIQSGDGGAATFGEVCAILYYLTSLRVFSGAVTGDNLWNGGNSPFDSLTLDTSATNVDIGDGDAVVFNDEIYATDSSNITRYDGTTENSVSSGLTDNTAHLLAVFTPDGNGERLYVTEGNDKVWSVNQSNSLASSSTYTLDLALEPWYQIRAIRAGTDRIWIALGGTGGNTAPGFSWVISWDGITANSPLAKYKIDSSMILSMVIKDDVPYILDVKGRLMRWNGGAFTEVARFPVKGDKLLNWQSNSASSRLDLNSVHHKGMTVDRDEILINISNLAEGSDDTNTVYHDFPAGVWAYSETHGLYHKYSLSYQAIADTGTTNLTDFGQFRAAYAGPIHVQETADYTSSDGGRVVFGMSYFTSSADQLVEDVTYGIFTDDTPDNTQKGGWIVTPKFDSSNFRDNWRKLYPAFSKLETTGDLVGLKYRTDETTLTTTAQWASTTDFVCSDSLSDFEAGDEVAVIQGPSSGQCVHLKRVESAAGSHGYLDTAVVSASSDSKVRIEKWRKITEITSGEPTEGYTIGKKAQWIQFKIYMQWTGAREFYSLLIDNVPSITA